MKLVKLVSKTLCLWCVKCLRGDCVTFQKKTKNNKGLFFGPVVSVYPVDLKVSHVNLLSVKLDGVRLF